MLKAKKVGFITNAESVSSHVTHKENIAWLTGVAHDDVNEDGKTDTDTDTDEWYFNQLYLVIKYINDTHIRLRDNNLIKLYQWKFENKYIYEI